jgi:hypothetical protein
VPHQPPDRVGALRRRLGQLAGVEPLDHVGRQGRDPALQLEQQRSDVHAALPSQNPAHAPFVG